MERGSGSIFLSIMMFSLSLLFSNNSDLMEQIGMRFLHAECWSNQTVEEGFRLVL
jgi:hypothetical protein